MDRFQQMELIRNQQAAWDMLWKCDIAQTTDTILATVRGNIPRRTASGDSVLITAEYDVIGVITPGSDSGLLSFQPGARRDSEFFAVIWDDSGKPAIACGFHRANHAAIGRFRNEQFSAADGSRARWESATLP